LGVPPVTGTTKAVPDPFAFRKNFGLLMEYAMSDPSGEKPRPSPPGATRCGFAAESRHDIDSLYLTPRVKRDGRAVRREYRLIVIVRIVRKPYRVPAGDRLKPEIRVSVTGAVGGIDNEVTFPGDGGVELNESWVSLRRDR
jgi:hypothetical protein